MVKKILFVKLNFAITLLIIQQFLLSAQYYESRSHTSKVTNVIRQISVEKLHLCEPGLSGKYVISLLVLVLIVSHKL